MSSFGEKFKKLRVNKKLTQEELVTIFNEKYNLSFGKSAISQYENNKRIPEIHALIKFADYFNVSLDYLLCRNNNNMELFSFDGLTSEDIKTIQIIIERIKIKNKNNNIVSDL